MNNPATATPAKLRDGSWGARVTGAVAPGDVVTITTRAGKTWQARIMRVVWTGEGVTLCATSSLDDGPPRRAARRYRQDCRRYGWDGVEGSTSYYTSGQYDEDS